MRARDLAEPFPVVTDRMDALEATRILTDQALPGLVVLDEQGAPLVVLAASEVLRFAIPDYIEEDPALAAVIPEDEADQLCRQLAGHTVAALMPALDQGRRRPVVDANATVMQIASVMSEQRSPVVAVTDGDEVLGVITVHRLLGVLLP